METATRQDTKLKISSPNSELGSIVTNRLHPDGIFSTRYRGYLMWKCRQMVENHHDAEELVSRTLTSLYETYIRGDFANDYDEIAHSRAVQKLKWVCINHYRDKANYRKRIDTARTLGAVRLLSDVCFPETHQIDNKDAMTVLVSRIHNMPDLKQRKIVLLWLNGMSQVEIGKKLNLHKSSVWCRIRSAISWLRDQQAPDCDTQPELRIA